MPMSFQFGAIAVRTMSAASMNSRPNSNQRARLNHAARRMPCVAALRSSGTTICDSASSAPIEIIRTETASRASAMPPLISRKSSSMSASGVHHAAEAEMRSGRIDGLRHARRGAITPTVVRRAQVRAALHHAARNAHLRLRGIEALLLRAAARILGNAARFQHFAGMARAIPVRRPLPHVADHVEQAVAIRRIGADGRGAGVTILRKVLRRKLALPGVGAMHPLRRELVAPRELRAFQSTACREL